MKRHVLIVVLLLCWNSVALASISTEINRSSIQLGEMFRLVLTIDYPEAGGAPDLSPLQKDFTIVGTERSTAYTIVNGETHSVHQWIVLLMAKTTGTFVVPSIRIGTLESTAGKIEVTAVKVRTTTGDEESSPQGEVMLKTEVDSAKSYINQQLIYTVKLYNSQRLLDAEYQPPRVDDALLIPLGDGHRTQTVLNGHGYTVEEQQYAIFPQKSGDLRIKSPSFKAVVYEAVPRQINVHDKTRVVKVMPIPANHTGQYWLPAKQVALTETYDKPSLTMNQGSALVRTVTLQAAGVPAQLLPPLDFSSRSDFSIYPEKPDLKNTARQQELIGRVDVKVTYILNKDGHITIPALHVSWFNTDTGQEEIASLPERVLDIIATEPPPPKVPTTAVKNAHTATPVLSTGSRPRIKANGFIVWMMIGFGLAILVIGAFGYFCRGSLVKRRVKRLALKTLRDACSSNDPQKTHEALLHWARVQWPEMEFLNLNQLAKMVHDRLLKKQVIILMEALYRQEKHSVWRGDELWRRVSTYKRPGLIKTHKNSGLPPINPT